MPAPNEAPSQQRIGRYVLLGRLGRGGMGEVHRARAFGAAGVTKELCIKRIRRSKLAETSSLARFVQEARLWMRLSHANIVQVFDFGRIENDYYLAMEWVDGCDLSALLEDAERGARLAEEEALYLATEIARALSYLHDTGERGVAHCDLKPSNVLVSKKSEVKLADFGVAVTAESARAGGTRGYIPPTELDRVGTATDLYALGRVLEQIAARTVEGESQALLRTIAADLSGEAPTRTAARSIESELEAALARARVASGRPPRELLSARVGAVPSAGERDEHESVQTDASFLSSTDEASFLEQMGAGSELSTSTASRPSPAPPAVSPPAPARWMPIALLGLGLVVVAALASSRPGASRLEPPSTPAPTGRSTRALGGEGPAASPSVDETAPAPAPAEGVRAEETSVAPLPPAPTGDGARVARPRPALPAPSTEPPPLGPAGDTPALVRVNARPWADVVVDGVSRGPTPLRSVELAPGHHVVRLSNPATGREETVELDLAPGEHRDVIADLR